MDVTGEGSVAGALNIVLKYGEDLEGAFVRAGGSFFADDDVAGPADESEYQRICAPALTMPRPMPCNRRGRAFARERAGVTAT